MIRQNTLKVLCALLAIICCQTVFAQSGKVSIQGILKNFDGTVYNGTSADMTFKIYTQASGGTAIWSESQTAVPVNGGVYNAMLGSTAPGLSALQLLPFDQKYFLGITVEVGANPLEMTPRIELAYSINSLRADYADKADSANVAQFANMAYGVAFSGGSGISEAGGDLTLTASASGSVIIDGTGPLGGVLEVDSIKSDFNYIIGNDGASALTTTWTGKWFVTPAGDTLKVYRTYLRVTRTSGSGEGVYLYDTPFNLGIGIYPLNFNVMVWNGGVGADGVSGYTTNFQGTTGRIAWNGIHFGSNIGATHTFDIYAEWAGKQN